MIKECEEEASVPRKIAEKAFSCGAISYFQNLPRGLIPETLFVYDLNLPEDFVPVPLDGEVQEFYLWEIDQVLF